MDELSFTLDYSPTGNREVATIWINGSNLVDLIADVERPFAQAEGAPDIAGRYDALPPKIALAPSRHLMGRPDPLYSLDGRPFLLVCECEEPGCWPLVGDIIVQKKSILWARFEQPFRSARKVVDAWKYDLLFEFDRKQYEAALALERSGTRAAG